LYPRALTEIPKNADHADRQGSDKVAATQSPPMLSQNELDGFLREAYHNKLMPGQCGRKGCKEPTGGLKVGGLSCDNPKQHPQIVSPDCLEQRSLAYYKLAKLTGDVDFKKCIARWKLMCKGCEHDHHKDVSTTM
jgi:hypothetical protein